MSKKSYVIGKAALMMGLFIFSSGVWAGEAPFYQGKTLTVVQGAGDPGGTADLRTRAVTTYLSKHLGGNPAVVFQYMSGGGGLQVANYVAAMARRDGLTIGVFPSSVFDHAIVGNPGARFELKDFVFLGSPIGGGGPYTLAIRPALALDGIEKLRAFKGLRFAERSVGHTMYIIGRVMAFILELREPRWIVGYGSSELGLALERGEADARANSLPSIVRETPHWLKEEFGFPVVMRDEIGRGLEVAPEFPQNRPYLESYVDTELKRGMLRFRNAVRPAGNVFVAPRGVPEPALRALQEALARVWKDPQFVKDYQKQTQDLPTPVTGQEIEDVLRELPMEPKIREVFKQVAGPGPLPPSR